MWVCAACPSRRLGRADAAKETAEIDEDLSTLRKELESLKSTIGSLQSIRACSPLPLNSTRVVHLPPS